MTDIKIKELVYNNKEITDTLLELQFTGSDINYILLNAIRRIILLNMPNFAFETKNIKIDHNTSAYNNDMLRLRISNMPILNATPNENVINFLDYLENNEEFDKSTIPVLSMTIDAENKTTDIMEITTNNAKFFINDKLAPNYPIDFLIVKLKPNEKLKLTASTSLDIPKKNDIFASVCICVYEYEDDNNITFRLESRGNLTEYELIKRACIILIKKLKFLLERLSKTKFENLTNGKIIIEKETFTLANLIKDGLQKHKNIQFAGFKVNHLLIEESEIKYVTDGKSIIDILKDSIGIQVKQFEHIIKLLK